MRSEREEGRRRRGAPPNLSLNGARNMPRKFARHFWAPTICIPRKFVCGSFAKRMPRPNSCDGPGNVPGPLIIKRMSLGETFKLNNLDVRDAQKAAYYYRSLRRSRLASNLNEGLAVHAGAMS
jgi:hypothetical protein